MTVIDLSPRFPGCKSLGILVLHGEGQFLCRRTGGGSEVVHLEKVQEAFLVPESSLAAVSWPLLFPRCRQVHVQCRASQGHGV